MGTLISLERSDLCQDSDSIIMMQQSVLKRNLSILYRSDAPIVLARHDVHSLCPQNLPLSHENYKSTYTSITSM